MDKRTSPITGMYLHDVYTDADRIKSCFPWADVKPGMEMECWSTPLNFPSPTDFNILMLRDMNGELIATKREEGY